MPGRKTGHAARRCPPTERGETKPGAENKSAAENKPAAESKSASAAKPATIEHAAKAESTPTRAVVDPLAPQMRALLERLRPWAIRHRIALFSAGALISAGIFLGVLLGNLRHSQPAAGVSPEPSPAASASAPASNAGSSAIAPVTFDIRPWGEVFIDGKALGVAPPLTKIELPAGRHHIEIRHALAPAWSTDIEVQGGTSINIDHQFE